MQKRVKNNETYDVNGHVVFPYNSKIRDIFFSRKKQTRYKVSKAGKMIVSKADVLGGSVFRELLKKVGYSFEKVDVIVYESNKEVNGIPVVTTRQIDGEKTVELVVLVRAPDFRTLLKSCDSLVEYVEEKAGIRLDDEAKLWLRQEVC